MGLVGIPLNVGTAMIATCAIGIAVDDTIHLFTRYYQEMQRLNKPELAIAATIRGDFRPVCTTSVALAAGFSILGFTSFVPIAQYGLLSALVMVFAFATDLLLTPVLLAKTKLFTLWDFLGLRLTEGVIQHAELFREMTRTQIKKVVLLGRVSSFAPQDYMVRQGDLGRTMYLILEGGAQVEYVTEEGHRMMLRDLSEGHTFGEVALVNEAARTASVVATAPTRVLALDWASLERSRRVFPTRLFLNISRILGTRLASTTAQLDEPARHRHGISTASILLLLFTLAGNPFSIAPAHAQSTTPDPFSLLDGPAAEPKKRDLFHELYDNTSLKLYGRLSAFYQKPEVRAELDDETFVADGHIDMETRLSRGRHQFGTALRLAYGSQQDTYDQNDYFVGVEAASEAAERNRRYVELDELFWISSWHNVDLTLGKKRFNSGVAPLYSPVDRLNPIDLNDPLDPRKSGLWQAVIESYHGDTTFTLGLFPFFIPPKIPSSRSRWRQSTISSTAVDFQFFNTSADIGEALPEGVDELQVTGRIKTTWKGWDVFAIAASGIGAYPVLRNDTIDPANPILTREYIRATTLGFGFSTTFAKLELHGESLVQWSDDDKDDDYIVGLIGGTYTFDDLVQPLGLDRVEITVDYAGEGIFDRQKGAQFQASSSIVRVGQNDLIMSVNIDFNDDLSLKCFANLDLDENGTFVSPALRYRPTPGLWLTFSAEMFLGPDDSFYGRWDQNDRFLLAMEYSFH